MQNRNRGRYEIAGSEVVAEGGDMRVSVLTLAAGQEVPWHYHSEITDSFVCLEGPMVVETRAPRHAYRLEPGQRCAVPPNAPNPTPIACVNSATRRCRGSPRNEPAVQALKAPMAGPHQIW